MDVLVLGGNGYLGSKIVKRLLADGENVTCTKRQSSDTSRIQEVGVNWVSASMDAVEEIMKCGSFDLVLNAVCDYGRGNAFSNNVLEANLEFPLKVLNKAVEHGIKNFMTIGTGLPDEFNMYCFSKKAFSEFGRFYVKKHGINFFNMKLEMFYGFDEPEDRFLPSVIHNMIKGAAVDTTLGTQKRDIISVDDVVTAVLMILHANMEGYHEIPVGTGDAPAISEVVEYIWNETGNKSKWNKGSIPMRKNEPDCRADTALLKSIGTWNPVKWETGIRDMIKNIEKHL